MVVLGVRNESELLEWYEMVKGILSELIYPDSRDVYMFREEDLDDECTAFAVIGDHDLGGLLKHLRLL